MIGINKCLSVKVCLLLFWLQLSWKLLKYIFEMGVNRKFDFRQVWKFCWDLSNVISGGNWLFRWDYFSRWEFAPLYSFVIFMMAYWYRHPNSGTPKKGNIHFFALTFSFSGCFLNLKLRKTCSQLRKPSNLFKTILKHEKPVLSRKLVR